MRGGLRGINPDQCPTRGWSRGFMHSVNNRLRCFAQGWACQPRASCFPSWPEWIFRGSRLYPHHAARQRRREQTGAVAESTAAARHRCRAPSTRARAMPGQPRRAAAHRPCEWGRTSRELGGLGAATRPRPAAAAQRSPGCFAW